MQIIIRSKEPVYTEGETPLYVGLSVCADVSDETCVRSGPNLLDIPEGATDAQIKKAIEDLYEK
jgi:hypothetical protein